jgi:hypothetical protein
MMRPCVGYAAMVVFLLSDVWGVSGVSGVAAYAQSRLNDKNIARQMQIVKDDAQRAAHRPCNYPR